VALVIATLAAVPLLMPDTLAQWNLSKQLLFHVLTLSLMGLALCQTDPKAGVAGWRRLLAGPNLPAALLVLLGGISFLSSGATVAGSAEFLRLTCGVALYFVVAAFFRGRDRIQLLADVIVGVVIITSLLGLVSHKVVVGNSGGFISTFGNRQLTAGFLVLVAPLMLALPMADLTPGRKIASQIAAVLACAGLLLAEGRSAWLGALVGVSVLAVLVWRFHDSRKSSISHLKQAVIVPAVLIVGAVGVFLLLSRSSGTIGNRAATFSSPQVDGSWAWRQEQWQGTLAMIAKKPLFGWGIGAYPVAQAEFVKHGLPKQLVAQRNPSLLEMAHNEYLQLTAELGVVGLLAYLSLIVAFFVTTIRSLGSRRSSLAKAVVIGATAGVAAITVDALANPALRFADVSMFLWALMGLAVAAARPAAKENTEPVVLPAKPRATWSPARLGWQGAVVLFVGAMLQQATAAGINDFGTPIPEYLRPRSAFVRPQNGVIFQGQTLQYKLLVRFINGQFGEITGPFPGLQWQVLVRRGGPPTDALVETSPGSGLLVASTDNVHLGKTFIVRGIYTAGGATVAGVGRGKIPVPFGRAARVH
jgi:O-antigen ligase